MIPSSPQIDFNRGMIHLSLNDHRSALESFQQSVRRDKSTQPSPVEFMQLGVLLFWLEKYELAYENFSVALLVRISPFFFFFPSHPSPPRYKLIVFFFFSPLVILLVHTHKHTQSSWMAVLISSIKTWALTSACTPQKSYSIPQYVYYI
jgi:tetratricopeptide (TPR) repeat protein